MAGSHYWEPSRTAQQRIGNRTLSRQGLRILVDRLRLMVRHGNQKVRPCSKSQESIRLFGRIVSQVQHRPARVRVASARSPRDPFDEHRCPLYGLPGLRSTGIGVCRSARGMRTRG
jgi:hypothetical protein